MTKEEWQSLRYFDPSEAWGDPDKMSYPLLLKLDALRKFCGNKIIVHCGYAIGGHAKNSQHYLGKAIDCHVQNMTLLDFYLAAERFCFGGIGIYDRRAWENNPGLHLDVRLLVGTMPAARWAKVHDLYIPLLGAYLKTIEE